MFVMSIAETFEYYSSLLLTMTMLTLWQVTLCALVSPLVGPAIDLYTYAACVLTRGLGMGITQNNR